MAYTAGLEDTSVSVDGQPRTYTLRATQVYRRESGEWRVAHRHCATVGRDPAQITVTYKATMAVAETRAQARAAWDQWAPSFGLGEPVAEAGAFVGEPAEIAEMIRPFLNAGIDHLVVELAGGAGPESVALAAKALTPLMPAVGI
jgi:alkanesulfonate monooxygenase SsuD/methylene tetrahydromethanopterin reductase-like flavin-dependent oxidoreductase (luciferase family)